MDNCKKASRLNPKLRYQVRLGTLDIELWTKNVEEIQYMKTPLLEFGMLPSIDGEGFQPMEDRAYQFKGNKRQRSQSPQQSTNKRFEATREDVNLDNTVQEEILLNSAMDQQDSCDITL